MSCAQSDRHLPPVIRITGAQSNVGKTTLVELLIPALVVRGLRVGTVKHTHHGFDLDRPGKDSYRHGTAGAVATVLVGPTDAAVLLRSGQRLELQEAVERVREDVDLILAEGFRSTKGPAVILAPGAAERFLVGADCIEMGVMPDQLTDAEVAQIVQMCCALAAAPGR